MRKAPWGLWWLVPPEPVPWGTMTHPGGVRRPPCSYISKPDGKKTLRLVGKGPAGQGSWSLSLSLTASQASVLHVTLGECMLPGLCVSVPQAVMGRGWGGDEGRLGSLAGYG